MYLKPSLVGRLDRVPPTVVDTALALSFTGVSLLLGQESPPRSGWPGLDGFGEVLTCLVNLQLVLRRRLPVAVCLGVCLVWAWYIAAGYWPVVNSLAALLVVYTVAAHRRPRTAAACAAVMGGVWVYAGWSSEESSMATVLAQSVIFPAVMYRFGSGARRLAERNEQLAAMTERLRREQEERERRAVAEERVRIARELHDVVAHHMSVISVQAGLAGYVFTSDPRTARTALDTIGATSGEALDEMRRLLAVLRINTDDPEDASGRETTSYDPAPGLGGLGEVADRVRSAGVPVELRITGEAYRLAPGVELCAYRVVQEALTNVLKHARPARATVRVDYQPRQLVVHVTDDGERVERGGQDGPGGQGAPGAHAGRADRAEPADHPEPATITASMGHGLLGMRERARICGGTLTAGRLPERGFEICLTLPSPAASAVPSEPAGPGAAGPEAAG